MRFKDDDKRYYLVSYNSDLLYFYDRLDNKIVKKCTKDSKGILCDTAGCTTDKGCRYTIFIYDIRMFFTESKTHLLKCMLAYPDMFNLPSDDIINTGKLTFEDDGLIKLYYPSPSVVVINYSSNFSFSSVYHLMETFSFVDDTFKFDDKVIHKFRGMSFTRSYIKALYCYNGDWYIVNKDSNNKELRINIKYITEPTKILLK